MRLIDANELIEHMFLGTEYDKTVDDGMEKTEAMCKAFKCGWNDALASVMDYAPTVDAVEVVRCKDCYYCVTEKSFDKEYLYCDAFYEHAEGDLIGVSLMVEPNHFCSWGERREDETD